MIGFKMERNSQHSYILYISPRCGSSHRIIEMLKSCSQSIDHIFIQNIDELSRRPLWLTGTPILADQTAGMLHKGTDAFVYLENVLQLHVQQQQQQSTMTGPIQMNAPDYDNIDTQRNYRQTV